MTKSRQTDLSMNWAIDKITEKSISARYVFNNQNLKKRDYICIGCFKLIKNRNETYNMVPKVEHVNGNQIRLNPFFRRGKGQYHLEDCPYRNPDSYVKSLTFKNGIALDGKRLLIKILPGALNKGKSGSISRGVRDNYCSYFTGSSSRKFFYFLQDLIQDLELDSFKKMAPPYYVETEDGHKIKLSDLIGYQDHIIERIDASSRCMAAVVGTVQRVIDNGHVRILFSINRNEKGRSKPFQLFVPKEYRATVGDLKLLEGQRIACYGPAEKVDFGDHRLIYQMELYSIGHQVVFLDGDPPEGIERSSSIPIEPYIHLNEIVENCHSFFKNIWGARQLTEKEVTHFHVRYYGQWFKRLKQEKTTLEGKDRDFKSFMDQWKNIQIQYANCESAYKYWLGKQQEAEEQYQSVLTWSNRLLSKIGFSKKIEEIKMKLDGLNVNMSESKREFEDISREKRAKEKTEMEWNKWTKDIKKVEEDYSRVTQLKEWENQCKAPFKDIEDCLFIIPIGHKYWTMIVGMGITTINNEFLQLEGYVQLYHVHNDSWLPYQNQSQLRMVEKSVKVHDLNQIPEREVKRFYGLLGEALVERMELAGWPKEKMLCPKCCNLTWVRYNRKANSLNFLCRDKNCSGKLQVNSESYISR